MLLVAQESNDSASTLKAIRDILEACIEGLKAEKLCIADVEYAFVQLRAKAAGETTIVTAPCPSCDVSNKISISLDDVYVNVPDDAAYAFQIGEDIRVTLRVPTMKDAMVSPELAGASTSSGSVQAAFDMVEKVIDTVEWNDELSKFAEQPAKERADFIGTMSGEQSGHIRDFMEEMPALKLDIKFKCPACKEENDHKIVGIQNFFS